MAEVGEAGSACDACKVRCVSRTQQLFCMVDAETRDEGVWRTAEHVLKACFKAPSGSGATFNKKFDTKRFADVFLNVLDEPFQLWRFYGKGLGGSSRNNMEGRDRHIEAFYFLVVHQLV